MLCKDAGCATEPDDTGQTPRLLFRKYLDGLGVLKKSLFHMAFSGSLCAMPQNPDVRWRQRLQSFRKAFAHLTKAAALARQRELSELEQQGLIQAFEFTHELAWNTLKDFMESQGATEIYGSKPATREAFAKGLIANGEEWMAMIKSRNRSSHTYNEKTAEEVAGAILSSYVREFEKFLVKFTELETREP